MSEAFVSKAGVFEIRPGGRSGTPLLDLKRIIDGTVLRVTCNFDARTEDSSRESGFVYEIKTPTNDAVPLTPTNGIIQGTPGWTSVNRVAYFRAEAEEDPFEVEFEVEFNRGETGDLSGSGQGRNFVLIGDIVTLHHD